MMKKKVKIFDIVLIVIFTVFSLVMIIPVYKVFPFSFTTFTLRSGCSMSAIQKSHIFVVLCLFCFIHMYGQSIL